MNINKTLRKDSDAIVNEIKQKFWEQVGEKNKIRKTSVALIGLGPHARRIYINYLKKHKKELAFVVELESMKDEIRRYLDNEGFQNTTIFTIPDEMKYKEHLSSNFTNQLLALCKTFEITHMIISTEPKAHYMYIEFALKNNIHVLTDKPITVVDKMTHLSSVRKVKKQYYKLLELEKKSNANCKIMCQRQYHRGYEYIKSLLNNIVQQYQVPITYINIYHCDGNWEMPHDMEKENHPYKYGYGKLFHSGYHFIDLLSDLIKINNQLPQSKIIKKAEIYSSCFTPNDEINIFNINDFSRIFKNQSIPSYYQENKKPKFNNYGEKNFYGSINFINASNKLITHANLNLLHYGFSRRGWIESRDYYKSNGRIRHEQVNIQVGTLLNIQIHSYQSKEIKDRLDMLTEEQVGGLEHFDIYIFRNTEIIGGNAFEKITLGDLYSEKEKKNILGYNELSRETYLNHFFSTDCRKGDIKDQILSIDLLCSCAYGIHYHYRKKNHIEKLRIKDKQISIEKLRKYSFRENISEKKRLIDYEDKNINKEDCGVSLNYLEKQKKYEVYLHISIHNETIGQLLYKNFKNAYMAKFYYKFLKKILNLSDLNKIYKYIKKSESKWFFWYIICFMI